MATHTQKPKPQGKSDSPQKLVVEASGSAASARDPDLARKLQEAQVKAVEDAIARGIKVSDGEAMREVKRHAREAVSREGR